MKEFVEFIVKQLVDHPEDVKVVQVDSEKTVILELSVKEGDLGKVIGKKRAHRSRDKNTFDCRRRQTRSEKGNFRNH